MLVFTTEVGVIDQQFQRVLTDKTEMRNRCSFFLRNRVIWLYLLQSCNDLFLNFATLV